jgi:hypothetical protein
MHKIFAYIMTVALLGMNNRHDKAQKLLAAVSQQKAFTVVEIANTYYGEPVKNVSSQKLIDWLLRPENQKYLDAVGRCIELKTLTAPGGVGTLIDEALKSPFLNSFLIKYLIVFQRARPKVSVQNSISDLPLEPWFLLERSLFEWLIVCEPTAAHYAAFMADSATLEVMNSRELNIPDARMALPLFYAFPAPHAVRTIIKRGGRLGDTDETCATFFKFLIDICTKRIKKYGRDHQCFRYFESLMSISDSFQHELRDTIKDVLPEFALLDSDLFKKACSYDSSIDDYSMLAHDLALHINTHNREDPYWHLTEDGLCAHSSLQWLLKQAPPALKKDLSNTLLSSPQNNKQPLLLSKGLDYGQYSKEELR